MAGRACPQRNVAFALTMASWLGVLSAASGQTDRVSAGAEPAKPDRRIQQTSELLVFLEPGTDPLAFAHDSGLTFLRTLRSTPDAHVFDAGTLAAREAAHQVARGDVRAQHVYRNDPIPRYTRAFVPNDPYFHKDTPAAGWPGQWHLINEHVAGRDARVAGAWQRDITGAGVLVGICDDGLELTHPDLAPAYVAADSWDYVGNDADPTPIGTDKHGTSVAGVTAARGGNGIGVCGAAPQASLAGLRLGLGGGGGPPEQYTDVILFHSSGNNTNIKIKNHSYGNSTCYLPTQAEYDAYSTSTAAGTIHCIAAGNDRGYGTPQQPLAEECVKQHTVNNPNVITVLALGSDGRFASYSNYGTCAMVTAPSSSFVPQGLFGITTTDRLGAAAGYNNGPGETFPNPDYTSTFGGTSSATPLVAGVLALVKQVQPNLNARFAKHLLALTSDVVDPNDNTATSGGGWHTNAAGFHFNNNYGFGLIDANELTQRALDFTGVSELVAAQTSVTNVGAQIPDGQPAGGVSRTFTADLTDALEEVLVYLDITHPYRGDVEAYLTSPGGTTSRLLYRYNDPDDNINWTFCTNAFWGESPAGTWTLRVADAYPQDVGTWNKYAVLFRMGQLIPVGGAAVEIQTSATQVEVPEGGTATFQVRLSAAPTGATAVAVARSAGDTDITVQSGANLSFDANTWSAWQTVTLAAAADGDQANGQATIQCSATGLTTVNVLATEKEVVLGTLTVDTSPVKGEVFVDQASWGSAPQTRQLAPGAHTVTFGTVSGYAAPAAQQAAVTAGQTTTVTGVYAAALGTLAIDTEPVKGTIKVDGALWGLAPQSREVSPGAHVVTFGGVNGYDAPPQQTATVVVGQTTNVKGTYAAQAPPPAQEVHLTVRVAGPGTVDPNGGTFAPGERVKLTAKPKSAGKFDHWEDGLTGSQNPATLTIETDVTVTAVFVAKSDGADQQQSDGQPQGAADDQPADDDATADEADEDPNAPDSAADGADQSAETKPDEVASTLGCGAGACGAGVVGYVPLTLFGLGALKLRRRQS